VRSAFVARTAGTRQELEIVAAQSRPGGCDVALGALAHSTAHGTTHGTPHTMTPADAGLPAGSDDAWLRRVFTAATVVAVPIILSDGSCYGIIAALDPDPREIGRAERALLAEAAQVVAAHIEQDRLRHRQEVLLRATGEGVVGLDRQGVITFVSHTAARSLGYAAADLIGRSHHALFHHKHADGTPYHEDDCPIVASLRDGVKHRKADEAFWRKTGRAVPVEYVCTPMPDADAPDAAILIFRDVTESRAFEEEMLRQAYHDPLTALPNRTLFMERLEQLLQPARRSGDGVAVLFLDLDRFKNINDSLGHGAGDELLITVSQRVAACLRQEDTVARFGGDEFAVLLTGVRQSSDALRVAEKILATIQEPFILDGHEAYVGTSVGIAVAGPRAEAGALLRDADVALYRAKSAGKGRCIVFEESMPAFSVERLSLETDLRRALERREMRVYYQPVLDLGTEKIAGAEALVRWEHPKHGLVSPIDFIPMAEETGLILAIGKWVLDEACLQASRWQQKYEAHEQFTMAVNLSARQFQQPNLVEQVAAALRNANLEPSRLRLEITESILMENVDATHAQLVALHDLGVKLAIDDFGTGYSSLSYIQRFPVDTIKIDRSFVSGLDEDARNPSIVQAAASLAHALGMDVTAEGIETVDQLRSLQGLNCDHGQGYLFARPLSSEAVDSLLANGIPRDQPEP
jgi:diguanylate cyclase (GGDEF)-like protein/PAS domain S-box-containing protein